MTEQLTLDQYRQLPADQRREARKAGRLRDALAGLAPDLAPAAPATPPAAPSTDGAGKVGAPVGGPKQITTREEYAALPPEERRAAREDGRLDELLGRTHR